MSDFNPDEFLASTAGPKEEAFNPDSFIADTEDVAKEHDAEEGRELLTMHSAGEVDLTPEQKDKAIAAAREGKGPWTRLGDGLGNLLDIKEGVKAGYEFGKEVVGTVAKAADALAPIIKAPLTFAPGAVTLQLSPEETQARRDAVSKLPAQVAAGTARGVAGIGTVAAGAITEVDELQGALTGQQIFKDTAIYDFQHDIQKFITQSTGVAKDDPVAGTVELASNAILPIGVEAKAAPLIAKAADRLVESTARPIGKTMSAMAKTAKAVGPAAVAGEALATGHPFVAMMSLAAGYMPERFGWLGSIKHAIMDKGLGAIHTVGKAMSEASYGVPLAKEMQNGLAVEAGKLEAKIADIRSSASPKQLNRVDKMHPDGTPVYDLEELSTVEKEIRVNQERLKNANLGVDRMEKYAKANRILSDLAKYGLSSAGNLAVAETVGSAFTSAGAPPGDKEAQHAGMGMGMVFGLPGLHRANVHGKAKMLRSEMIGKGKKLMGDADLTGLTPEQMDSVYAHRAEVEPLGGKIEILSPEEILKRTQREGMPPEEGATAPNGIFDPKTNTLLINKGAIESGVIGHEFGHLADKQLDLAREQFSKDIQDRIDSGSGAYKKFSETYVDRMRKSDPKFKELTPEQINQEVKAEISRLIKSNMPLEAFYGGKGGGTIVKEWFDKKFNKDSGEIIGEVDGFGAPYTKSDVTALKDVFYEIGEKARSGEKFPEKAPKTEAKAPEGERPDTSVDPMVERLLPFGATPETAKFAITQARKAAHEAGITDEGEIQFYARGIIVNGEGKFRNPPRPKAMPVTRGNTIGRPASKINDMIFPGTRPQAIRAAKKLGLEDLKIEEGFLKEDGSWLNPEEARALGEDTGQLPEGKLGSLTPQDLANERRFMPSSHPDAIDKPAMKRLSDGKVFVAKNGMTPHWMMPRENPQLKDRFTSGGVDRYIDGWVDNSGNFLDKKEGHARALKVKQIDKNFKTEYKGALSTLDMNEGRNFMPSVNIGLDVKGGERMAPEGILAELGKYVDVKKHTVHQSDSEPTLVADLSRPLTPEEAHKVSEALDQEAIAQHDGDKGELYGPKADAWKPFNPEYYLNHDGKRLSEVPNRPNNAPDAPVARPDLSGVSMEPTPRLNENKRVFEGKTIEMGEEPWSIRLKELADKEWGGKKLADAEETEFTQLRKKAEAEFGSYANWFEQQGGEKDYLGKVFGGEKQKIGGQFMPSSHPDAITDAAIKTPDGRIWSDVTHGLAHSAIESHYPPSLLRKWQRGVIEGGEGFVTKSGRFLNRDEALAHAKKIKQIVQSQYARAADRLGMDSDYLEATSFDDARNFMPSPAIEREASRLGLEYKGDMGEGNSQIHLYNDPITKSTISVKANAERGNLQEKLRAQRDLFRGSKFMPSTVTPLEGAPKSGDYYETTADKLEGHAGELMARRASLMHKDGFKTRKDDGSYQYYKLDHDELNFMPSVEDAVSRVPIYGHRQYKNDPVIYGTYRRKSATYRGPDPEAANARNFVEGKPIEYADIPDPLSPSDISSTKFAKMENPLITVGSDQAAYGEVKLHPDQHNLYWRSDEAFAEARRSGHDGVIALSPDAIPFKIKGFEATPEELQFIRERIKERPGTVDWEHRDNQFAPFDESQLEDTPGIATDKILDRYNGGKITKEQMSGSLKPQFMPAPPPSTPEFKKWFKESKVTDHEGNPKIVFHGTAADFNKFDKKALGSATEAGDTSAGFFFTEDPEGASFFAHGAGRRRTGLDPSEAYHGEDLKHGDYREDSQGDGILPVVLSIQKPFVIDAPEFSERMFGFFSSPKENASFLQSLKDDGYDGVEILRGAKYMQGNPAGNGSAWIVFKPTQIKSAIGNSGKWSSRKADIAFMPSMNEEAMRELDREFPQKSLSQRLADDPVNRPLPPPRPSLWDRPATESEKTPIKPLAPRPKPPRRWRDTVSPLGGPRTPEQEAANRATLEQLDREFPQRLFKEDDAIRQAGDGSRTYLGSGDPMESLTVDRMLDQGHFTQHYMPSTIGEAKKKMAAGEKIAFETDEMFWTKAWPQLLKSTGLAVSPKNEKNINIAAERSVEDVRRFLDENPRFKDYYNKDWEETKKEMDSHFKRDMSEDEMAFFKLAEGLTSPNTSLETNTADAMNVTGLYLKDGNLEAIKMGVSPKGNRVLAESPVSISGNTNGIKAFTLKAIDRLSQNLGGSQKAAEFLMESVTVPELEEFKRGLGYKGKVGKLGSVKELVEQATGQSEKIPRMFVFGRKVGAYTLNLLGDHKYNTVDIWESRFIRSQFKDMFKETSGAPQTKEEHTLFSRFTELFNEEFKKQTGMKLENSALQAARWFYMIDAAKKAGYSGTNTGGTISEYVKSYASKAGKKASKKLEDIQLDEPESTNENPF